MSVQLTPARRTKLIGKNADGLYETRSGRLEFPVRDPKLRWVGCVENGVAITKRPEAQQFRHRYLGLAVEERTRPTKITFHELALLTFADNLHWKANTRTQHESQLKNALAPLRGLKANEIDVHRFIELVIRPLQAKGRSQSSMAAAIGTASLIFQHGMFLRPRAVNVNPVANLRAKDRTGTDTAYVARVVSPEELAGIFAETTPTYQAAFGLMGLAGLRVGEVGGLFWEDVTFSKGEVVGEIRVMRQKLASGLYCSPKTKASYGSVELCAPLERLLKTLWIAQGQPSGETPVLAGEGRLSPSTRFVAQNLTDAAKRAGIEGAIRPHDLRHSYGSALMARISSGIGVAKVSKQMRHENVAITIKTYTHEWDAAGQLGSAAAILDDVFSDVLPKLALVG